MIGKTTLFVCASLLLLPPPGYAMPPADKTAHFGVGYVVSDQLQRHSGLTATERVCCVALLAYAKERSDSRTDWRDFAATVAGAVTLEIRF